MDFVPDPLLLRKSSSAGNRTRDLGVSREELRPLDHRGGHGDQAMICINGKQSSIPGKDPRRFSLPRQDHLVVSVIVESAPPSRK
jgi:hypothetical protein